MFPFLHCSARVGIDDICALRFTEGAEAPADVFGSNSEMIRGAGLELGQRTGHGQREGLHLPDLLPVLLCCTAVGVVLMEGIEVIAVHSRTGPIRFRHTPGQHYAGLAGHQLQLRLLRRRGALRLGG